MGKSLLEGRSRTQYNTCYGDKCENNASSFTSIPDTSSDSGIAFVPTCKSCNTKIRSKDSNATTRPITAARMDKFEEQDKRTSERPGIEKQLRKAYKVTDLIDHDSRKKRAKKKVTPAYLMMNPTKNQGAALLNWQIANPKSGTGEVLSTGAKPINVSAHEKAHKMAVDERRTPAQKESILSSALVKNRDKKLKSHHDNMEKLRQRTVFENKNWYENEAPYNYDQSQAAEFDSMEGNAGPARPAGLSKKKRNRFEPKTKSGDIDLTSKEQELEESTSKRLGSIEKEYQAAKAARLAGKQFNRPIAITPR